MRSRARGLQATQEELTNRLGRAPKPEEFRARAVGVLRAAVKQGVIADPKVFDMPDWSSIRDRDDFRRLRAEVSAAADRRSG